MITGLKITTFRGFDALELSGLKQVNLIVGQNDVGKTSLLEAVAAAVNPDAIGGLAGLFRPNPGNVLSKHLRWLLADRATTAEVKATHEDDWVSRTTFAKGELSPRPSKGDETATKIDGLTVGYRARENRKLRVQSIPVSNRSPKELVPAFADAVRSPENERRMEQLLARVDPRIKAVRLDYTNNAQFIAVDLGLSERVPLSEAGQGVYRLVSIFSDLLGEQPEVALIDEIENGIHYTVHKQIWKGIAEVSAALGIQVFATTHSLECLKAAQAVFFDDDRDNRRDFAVIQLMRVKDRVLGKVLDEARVDAALENEIELR